MAITAVSDMNDRLQDAVLQFTHIARPGILDSPLRPGPVIAGSCRIPPKIAPENSAPAAGCHPGARAAAARLRYHLEAVVEVFPKAPWPLIRQIPVGRGDDAHVDRGRVRPPG